MRCNTLDVIRKQADIAGGCGYKIPPSISNTQSHEKNQNQDPGGGSQDIHPDGQCRFPGATPGRDGVHQQGRTEDDRQLMLGHESIATTTIYAQTQQDSVKISHGKFV